MRDIRRIETSKISLKIEERSLKNIQYLGTIAIKLRPSRYDFNSHYLEGTYSSSEVYNKDED